MKSLLVAPTLPNESGNGLAMRIGVFLEALCQLGEVELVVLPLFESNLSSNRFCRRLNISPTIIQAAGRAETHFRLLKQVADPRSRLEAFRQYGKPSLAASLSLPVIDDLRQWLKGRHFDLVHIARAYMLPAIDAWPKNERPRISVDLDEDDVKAQQRIATLHRLRGDTSAGDWLDAEAVAFERLLEQRISDADITFVSTEADRETLRARAPSANPVVAENAVAIPPASVRERQGSELLFVGGLGFFPNVDAASWLLDEILPELTRGRSDSPSLTIVGRNPPLELRRRAQALGVRLLDVVEDLAPIYASANVALIPIRAGGGSRIKLLEAAAHCVPIVATTIGAEGTRMRDGEEIWLADTTEAMIDTIATVLQSPIEAPRRALKARACTERFYSRQASVSALCRRLSEFEPEGASSHDV
jgi:glycosyltransferase involved in cell wall biosynthesis